jgi:hypothetical protein
MKFEIKKYGYAKPCNLADACRTIRRKKLKPKLDASYMCTHGMGKVGRFIDFRRIQRANDGV